MRAQANAIRLLPGGSQEDRHIRPEVTRREHEQKRPDVGKQWVCPREVLVNLRECVYEGRKRAYQAMDLAFVP